jgi:hypothetical protein
MDREFHYNITGIIAKRAGFNDEDAVTIAHACQLVDDNDALCKIRDTNTNADYEVYISQTMDILKPKRELMRIYPIFHFLPGNPTAPSARRSDGKMHILTTTPGGDLALNVMKDARGDSRPWHLHRLGVAAHAFADSWAHQNFVGWYDGINGEELNMLPNIGHADFMHHPDWVGHRWDDSRIISSQVINNHRFLDAARELFREFCLVTKNNSDVLWTALEQNLKDAMGPVFSGDILQGEQRRLDAYNSLFPLPEYDPHAWFNDAVDTEVRGFPDSKMLNFTIFKDEYTWKPNWQNSHWYKFQGAVKAHQAYCMTELDPLFRQMNVDLSKH